MNNAELVGDFSKDEPRSTKWNHLGEPDPDIRVVALVWVEHLKKAQAYIGTYNTYRGWWIHGEGWLFLHHELTLLCWQYINFPDLFD